ncbi:mechanosensitive ion channel family protein [Microbulbifer sp. THAF38]|uniref:mechanosensitive ion channel family protein n=1 Tax=Microbulbifer sp. THAF38 TaxID=2587856 RepID=UPI00126976B6|nr:mechanosensitive ion channel family protein [Microbulbifer sp. THAF38]QFT53642.1 putative MscS family protein YkuT [Microbulbifer sp. THAF38]
MMGKGKYQYNHWSINDLLRLISATLFSILIGLSSALSNAQAPQEAINLKITESHKEKNTTVQPSGESQTAPTRSNSAQNGEDAQVQEIDQLIQLLQHPERRAALIDNLKELRDTTTDKENPDLLKISDVLVVDEIATEVVKDYTKFLSVFGLTANQAGTFLLLGISIVLLLAVVLSNNLLANFMHKKLSPIRRKLSLNSNRFAPLFRLQRWLGYFLAALLVIYTASELFPATVGIFVSKDTLIEFAEIALALFSVLAIFVCIWEMINAATEHYFNTHRTSGNARMRTLIPLAKNILLFLLSIMGVLVLLSELDINVVPLLAGAGVFGIAVGFGAQALVKDFLTGFTVLLEDLLQIGDIVKVGGRTGEVTNITLRKVELRALNGTVYTVPFSDISVVDNLTKHFSYYMLEIGVAYRENTDDVIQYLHEVDKEMRESDEYGPLILEPLEVLGVDAFADSSVVIKARTKTKAHEKWYVGREFNRRIKLLFDKKGVEIPFPHQTLYFGEDKKGKAPAARIEVHEDNHEEKTEDKQSKKEVSCN